MKSLCIALILAAQGAFAAGLDTYTLTLKDHAFVPAELKVPAGKPFNLIIINQETVADEFELSAPHIEKVVPAGGQVRVRVRPLAAGTFSFHDDFHSEVKGSLVAK